jgi:flagellar hook-length control protein FliK
MADTSRIATESTFLAPLTYQVAPPQGIKPQPGESDFAKQLERASSGKADEPAGTEAPGNSPATRTAREEDPARAARDDQAGPARDNANADAAEAAAAAKAEKATAEQASAQAQATTEHKDATAANAAKATILRRLEMEALPMKAAADAALSNLAANAATSASQKTGQTMLKTLEPKSAEPQAATIPTTRESAVEKVAADNRLARETPVTQKKAADGERPAREAVETVKKEAKSEVHVETAAVRTAENRPATLSATPQAVELPQAQVKAEAVFRSTFPTLAFVELRDKILSKVESGIIQLADKGDPRLVIRLYPPELGKVQVDLSVADKGISVKINAENTAVREVILANADSLKTQVENSGHTVQALSVEVGNFRDPASDAEATRFGLGRRQGGRGQGGGEGDSPIIAGPSGIVQVPLARSGWLGRAVNLIV